MFMDRRVQLRKYIDSPKLAVSQWNSNQNPNKNSLELDKLVQIYMEVQKVQE